MPVNNDIKERLIALLRTIFQFENEDLDFGIYKILNHKKKEIESFIQKDLIEEIKKQLQLVSSEEQKKRTEELEQLKQKLIDLGIDDYESNPKYQEKKKQLENIKVSQELQKEIYNHIYAFFSRYYDKGDFISKRKYGKTNKYALPYNGEETLLHWANNDQYYIKTTESFKRYDFKTPRLTVSFRIVQAEEEKANVKSEDKKFFITSEEKTFDYENKTLNIYFDFRMLTAAESKKYPRPTQEQINQDNINTITKALGRDEKAADLFKIDATGKTLIDKQLNKYTRKNTSDYFIHKDLKSFLEREMDFYIKNELVDLSDVTKLELDEFNKYILEIKVIKNISTTIIDFLSQIENFQKKLWEKKKFVIKTDYCMTLDCIDQKYYSEILAKKEQLEEWKKLLNLDVNEEAKKLKGKITGHKGTDPKIEVLKKNPTLMLDTKFFDEEFKYKLLSEIDNLDDMTGGLLIYGENWQALNLLADKYRGRVKCIHIDPPYNTQTSGFLYKNNYQHSSWLAMMENRIVASYFLLDTEGSFLCHIDDNEYERLHLLFDQAGIPSAGTVVWDKRNPMTAGRGVATQHEYVIWRSATNKPIYLRNTNIRMMLNKVDELIRKHGGVTLEAKKEFSEWVKKNPELSGGEKAYCSLDDNGRIYRGVSLRAPEPRTDPKFFKPLIHPITGKPCAVPPNGFSRTPETLQAMIERGEIIFGPNETTQPQQKRFLTEESKRQISTIMSDARRGKTDLDALGLENFPYCHSVFFYMELLGAAASESNDTILDFFAGSGTTGHAVLNLNKEDGANRKFILVEMGQYFDTVLKPRIEKVIFAPNWKDGKPQHNNGFTKQIIKYQCLEQYEDALENIELPQMTLDEFKDYFVKYMLDFETRGSNTFLNIDAVKNPFNYKLKIIDNYEPKRVSVDLVETYNYLIGLYVSKISCLENKDDKKRRYMVVKGKRGGRSAIVIWRNTKDLDPQKDKEFITDNIVDTHYDEVHINGDNLIENSVLIEEQFKRLMNSG